MRISKKALDPFSKLLLTISKEADDIKVLNETLESLSIEELERTKAYFSGTGTRISFYQLRNVLIGSFMAGVMIFLLNMFQEYFFVAVIALLFFLACLTELFRTALTFPIKTNLALAYSRGKYDRVVSLTDIILAERYAEVRKNSMKS